MAVARLRKALVYQPFAEAGANTAAVVIPRLLAVAAIHPRRYNQLQIAELLDTTSGVISKDVQRLRRAGWLDVARAARQTGIGRPTSWPYATKEFWIARDSAEAAIPPQHEQHYREAVAAFAADNTEVGAEGSYDFNTRRLWVGAVAILGTELHLEESSEGWPGGGPGILTLVSTGVDRPPESYPPYPSE